MERDEIITIFNDLICGKRDKITYSNGYKEFEEIYKLFAKDFNLTKKNDNLYTTIKLGDTNEKRK